MTREELHAKLDRLVDSAEGLKKRAESALENRGEALEEAKLGVSVAADSVSRAACRGRNWLKGAIVEAALEIEDVHDKLEAAKADLDKAAAAKYTKALEKYAEDMLGIAQEAADEAADAVEDAVRARREFQEKFGE